MGCLYMLTFPSGKQYIGITQKDANTRFQRHIIHAKVGRRNAVHRAILKYGKDNVTVKTLVIADDLNYLRLIEKRAIQIYGTLSPKGYNLTGGGEESGFWAEETLQKARKSMAMAWLLLDEEEKKKRSQRSVEAMQKALSDPSHEMKRRKKISETMLSAKSNIPRGANRSNAKLNTEKVVEIRKLLADGLSDKTIALQFGVSRELIRDIRTGKRWKQ